MMRLFISLVIVLVLASCTASNKKEEDNTVAEVVADYVQVDSPNSFIPLGIGITVTPPEHGQNAKYFIANKYVAEVNFDYMNNNYTYRASKNTNNLLSFYGDYINSGKNFTEEENNIVVEYNTTSNNEKFTLWRVDDIYYILSTQAEDDKDLTNLSSLYIKSIYWHKGK